MELSKLEKYAYLPLFSLGVRYARVGVEGDKWVVTVFLTKNREVENSPSIDVEFMCWAAKKNKYPLCLAFTMTTVMIEWESNVQRQTVVLIRTAVVFSTLRKFNILSSK